MKNSLKISSEIMSLYDSYYENLSSLRGATFVHSSLRNLMLSSIENPLKYRGEKYHFSEKTHFWPILVDKVLEGYTKRYEIKENDVVVDAGAFPGEFSIYAARRGAKVLALEPDEENAEALRQNLVLNEVEENVTVKEKALSEGNEGKFISLEAILNNMDIEKVDFVKMDIEGAEIEALKGMKKIIQENRPNFAIASYHIRNGEMTSQWIEKFFSDREYDAITEFRRHRTTYISPK